MNGQTSVQNNTLVQVKADMSRIRTVGIASIWRENMLGYLSEDIIWSEQFSESVTVSFEKQIKSKNKYPSIFSPQIEAIEFIILQIFFAKRPVLKIGE